MGKEWCEHITYEYGNYYIYAFHVFSNWDICPVKGCHAPRPKEQRKLSAEDLKAVEDVLNDVFLSFDFPVLLIKSTLRERLG